MDLVTKHGYDVRVRNHMPQGTKYLGIPFRGFYALIITIALLGPFLLYTKGGQLIKSLQQSRKQSKSTIFLVCSKSCSCLQCLHDN